MKGDLVIHHLRITKMVSPGTDEAIKASKKPVPYSWVLCRLYACVWRFDGLKLSL